MFSYLLLTGLGHVQVSLFIQTPSPPLFHCSSHPPVLQDDGSSAPCSSVRSQPLCLRETRGFCPKAWGGEGKKAQQVATKNSHGSAALLGQEQGSPRGLCCQPFPKLPLHRHLCLELKVWVHQLRQSAKRGRAKLIYGGRYLALELSVPTGCVQHPAALNSLSPWDEAAQL